MGQMWTPCFGPPGAEIKLSSQAILDQACVFSLLCVCTITPVPGSGVQSGVSRAVAQASKPTVSPTSKSAELPHPCGLGNP